MPIQYSGIIEEHNATRNSAGLFDICHMGEFAVEANLDKSNLDNLLTVNIRNMPLNSCRYGFILNEEGGIIDDLVVYRISPERFMFVVNAATTESDLNYLQNKLTGEASVKNISGYLGKLDLQGPLSREILQNLIKKEVNLEYYHFNYFNLMGEDIIISRTGYTGELGFELYMPNGKIPALWDEILKDKRVKPVGLGARDTLRLEMGYSLYGQDIDINTTPLEAGLKSFIDWGKDFIGKQALLKQKDGRLRRELVCFAIASRRSARHNFRIIYKGSDVGLVTSGSFSPTLSYGIGLGYANCKISPGEEISISDGRNNITANITTRPFLKNTSLKR